MKKILSFGLKIIVSGGLLYVFFSRIDLHSVGEIFRQTRVPLFIVALLIQIIVVLVATKRLALFLPDGLSYLKLLSLYFIGSFFNTFLPGLVGGDAVKAFYLYKHTGKGGVSLAAVFMDRYMGFVAMGIIVPLTLLIGYPYIKGAEIVWVIPVFLGGLMLGSFILWKINWGKINFLSSFYSPLMEYKAKKLVIYKGILLGVIVQSLVIVSAFVLSFSIGLKIPMVYFFIFIPIISSVSAIPVSLAGIGIREASFIILFTKIGLTSAQALSLSLLAFITMCLVNLIGGIEYLRIGKPSEKKGDEKDNYHLN